MPATPLEYQTAEIMKRYIRPIDTSMLQVRLDLTSNDPFHHHSQFYLQGRIEEFPGLFCVDDPMIWERHQKWPEVIEDHFTENDDFVVVVGASHLVGERSILQSLIQRGFEVKKFISVTSIRACKITVKATKKVSQSTHKKSNPIKRHLTCSRFKAGLPKRRTKTLRLLKNQKRALNKN